MITKAVYLILICFSIIYASDIEEDIIKIILDIPFEIVAPTNVSENEVSFYLYTRNNPETPIQLFQNNSDILNKKKKFKFVTHGYIENVFLDHYLKIKDTLLEKGDYNVILVDWRDPSTKGYGTSAQHTREVGRIVGEKIIDSKIPLKKVELIGHSLGAHVFGFAGKFVAANSKSGGKVKRIIGLDPAGPLFEFSNANNSLTKTDAKSVLVFHTDGGVFGMMRESGTIDAYFNGGTPIQPGCLTISLESVLTDPIETIRKYGFCSHHRSFIYYTESINSNGFMGTKCDSYSNFKNGACSGNEKLVIGENTPLNASGIYHLDTNSSPPYAKG